MIQIRKKALSILIILCIVWGALPQTAFAAEEKLFNPTTDSEITEFASLDDNVKTKAVPPNTSLDDLGLPNTLTAMIDAETTEPAQNSEETAHDTSADINTDVQNDEMDKEDSVSGNNVPDTAGDAENFAADKAQNSISSGVQQADDEDLLEKQNSINSVLARDNSGMEETGSMNDIDSIRQAVSENVINLSDSDEDLHESAAASGGKYSYDDTAKIVTIHAGPVTVTGDTTNRQVKIDSNASVTLTLRGTKIDVSGTDYACALDCSEAGPTTLILAEGTTSEIKSGYDKPGIYVPYDQKLMIKGGGALDVTGGNYWPGIGRQEKADIEIQSGTVRANGGEYGAGIGGSWGYGGGNITISGGVVIAKGKYAAGIGCGLNNYGREGSNITISGGTVTATGNEAGIGGGINGVTSNITINGGSVKASSLSSAPKNSNGNPVYLGILPNQAGVTSVSVDEVPYYTDGNHDSDDNLYLYMTGEDHNVDVKNVGGTITRYKATWANFKFTWGDEGTPQTNPLATSVSLSVLPNPVIYGTDSIIITASVTDGSLRTRSLNSLNMVDFYLGTDTTPFDSKAVVAGTATVEMDISDLNLGDYKIKAVYAGSFGGESSEDTATLRIIDKPLVGSISVSTVNAGSILSPAPAVTDNGAVITAQGWEISTDGNTGWTAFDSSATKITYAHNGQYLRYYATNSVGTEYSSNVVQITVNRLNRSLSIVCPDIAYGGKLNPQLTGDIGDDTVTWEYKIQGAPDSDYSIVVPANAGDYTVRASIEATDTYNSGAVTADFSIVKITPTIQENSGVNGAIVGKTLSALSLSELKACGLDGAPLDGSFAWENPQRVIQGSGKHTVIFTPIDTANYNSAIFEVQVNLENAKPVIAFVQAIPSLNSAKLEVVATASSPLTYQWQVKGSWIDIPHATSANFEYTGLDANTEYTVRVIVTDANGNSTVSEPVTFKTEQQTVGGLPETCVLEKGKSVSWTPSPAGGIWQYDTEALSMSEKDGTVTFTAKKEGTYTLIYTVNGTKQVVHMTINDSTVPHTGDTTNMLLYLTLFVVSLAGVFGIAVWDKKHRAFSRKKRD